MRERRGRGAAQEKEAGADLVPAVLHGTGWMKQGGMDGRVGEKSRKRRKWKRGQEMEEEKEEGIK